MSAGADEVWGMIIFTEDSLLYNKKIGNLHQLRRIASTVCHEISHQVGITFSNISNIKLLPSKVYQNIQK